MEMLEKQKKYRGSFLIPQNIYVEWVLTVKF